MRHNKFSAVLFLFASVFGFLALAGEAGAADGKITYSRNVTVPVSVELPRKIYFTERNRWDAAEARSPWNLNLTVGGDHGSQVLYLYVADTYPDGVIDDRDYQYKNTTASGKVSVEFLFPEDMAVAVDTSPDLYDTEDKLKAVSEDLYQQLQGMFASAEESFSEQAAKQYRPAWTTTRGGTHPAAIDVVETPGVDEYRYHRRLGEVKVTPMQQGGNDTSLYNEQFATLKVRYSVVLPGAETASDDQTLWPETQLVNFTVRPIDQGGNNGDNGGGSCGVFGLGAALLLVPAAALLRRKRS